MRNFIGRFALSESSPVRIILCQITVEVSVLIHSILGMAELVN